MDGQGDRELRVEEAEAGLRLDHFLSERLGISTAAARRLLADGGVRHDGRAVGPSHKGEALATGARVSVPAGAGEGEARAVAEPDVSLRILAEGPGWVAIDKPAGMAVHPLRGSETGTALNALIARYPAIQGVGEGGLRSGVVHRLDVDTSGALLFATDEEAWRRLRALFAGHRVAKTYRAIVLGELASAGSAELLLRVSRARPARVVVVEPATVGSSEVKVPAGGWAGRMPPGARLCGMSWRPLEALGGTTLVETRPVTGFLHQVRVMLAHLGHPLAGDRVYGPPVDPTGATRHMLHAASIAWEGHTVACPDAPDFAALLERLRQATGGSCPS